MEDLAIISQPQAFSLWKVATDIHNVLKDEVPNCNLRDWEEKKIPEKNLLFVTTILSTSLHYLTRFLPDKNIVVYTTLEGEPIIDPVARNIADHIKIVAVSKFVETMLQRVELNCEGVVYHGIDMKDTQHDPRFSEFLQTIQHPPNKPKTGKRKYLTVSANVTRKGLDRLLLSHKLVEYTNPDNILILHSGGGYVDVASLANQLELNFERFWFTNSFGMYDNFQMNSLYKFSQFVVQPSYTEGFGLPITEAFRHGKPVIAIDAAPYNEIIENKKTGILIPVVGTKRVKFLNRIMLQMKYYRVNDMAEAIQTLLNDKYRKHLTGNITEEVKTRFDSHNTYPALTRFFE